MPVASRRLRVLSVVGTRPNFMKIAPIAAEFARRADAFEHVLVHTGQHFDAAMSEVFFEELGVGAPDVRLEVGPGTHGQTTARVMERLEPVLEEREPDVVLVPGDVNSTVAAALTAAKLGIHVGHVEAGLRSFDRSMPEELNRIVTDALSDLLFTHSPEARDHLLREGREETRIFPVGNTMIDTLVTMQPRIRARRAAEGLGLPPGGYVLVTLHRPALVDGPLLEDAVMALAGVAEVMPVAFPVHPRTRARLAAIGAEAPAGVHLLDPLGYLDFLSLVSDAAGVVTDSGGIQEETTFLGVPCLTLRANTERPVTVSQGTNMLLGLEPARIVEAPALLAEIRHRPRRIPPGWDGHASSRIADVLLAQVVG